RAMLEQVDKVLRSIGGVLFKPKRNSRVIAHIWEFDYDPEVVMGEIISSGCIPEKKSHQYYPTPSELAEVAIHMAEINGHHRCLE
ncbi:restriction endonuclease subunit M, partial [Xenorhabdus bovienii]|nr:restriction endonuclease subunit M [Xenorhabdus bovienii]